MSSNFKEVSLMSTTNTGRSLLVGEPVDPSLVEMLNERLSSLPERIRRQVSHMTILPSQEKVTIKFGKREIVKDIIYVELIFLGFESSVISLTFYAIPKVGEIRYKISKKFLNLPYQVQECTIKFCTDMIDGLL